ncbi:alpha-1,2-fucosyltransferase [Brachyspira intermedia]|uniref:alpha-1,2-fucosyltransferase n=1 Tax=Brachyspira intermedia TaxID=84377 RepID=UPI003007A96A
MVILYKRFGDKSNRLLQNIHFEAYCKHNNIEYHNLEFYDMEDFYGIKDKYSLKKLPNILLPPINTRYSIIENISNFCKKMHIKNYLIYDYMDINLRENIELYNSQILANKNKTIFVSGWDFRVTNLVYQYRDYFAQKYTPINLNSEEYNNIKNKFADYDLKVGIHIRRGDYKGWNNGRFFYEDEVYNDKIDQFYNLFPNKKILFIIFSNEEITLKPNHDYIISKCQWYEDHSLLSLCDYIIGAPSTFTIWASYIGDVPLYHIYSKDDIINVSNFNIKINNTPEVLD